jgi:hypothetical protein
VRGPVDELVNNEVVFNQKGPFDMPVAEYRRQVDVILSGAPDEASMITGSNITMDGGATAKYWPWVLRAVAAAAM